MDFHETVQDILRHVENNISLYEKHNEFKKTYPKLFAIPIVTGLCWLN